MRKDALAATAALLLLAGCGGTPAPVENNVAAETNAAAAPAAPSPEEQAALAALVPAYAGASEVRGAFGSSSVAFRTGDPANRVAGYYADIARAQGFTVDLPPTDNMLAQMNATRPGGGLISLTATRVGDHTEVQIMAAPGTPPGGQ